MQEQIEVLRAKLNEMTAVEDTVLYSGEILTISQKLDKLILIRQIILIKRAEVNYLKQLERLLSPELYAKIKVRAC